MRIKSLHGWLQEYVYLSELELSLGYHDLLNPRTESLLYGVRVRS
ncbi:hypothetical protein [Granulicella sp. 5B5]|nr:hypothetical protein [Granulicella sp. 5B5]